MVDGDRGKNICLVSGLSLMAIGEVCFNLEIARRANYIPKTEAVEPGYALPNKVSIEVDDLNEDGQKETILTYDGFRYLLMLDDDKRPEIRKFVVRPSKLELLPREKTSLEDIPEY